MLKCLGICCQPSIKRILLVVRSKGEVPLSALLSQHLCAGPGSGPASLPLHPVSSCWRFQNFLPGLVDGRPVLPGRIALDLLAYIQDATKQEESCNEGSGARYPAAAGVYARTSCLLPE